MPRTRVKICGVTTPDDARLAAEAGADAVGIVCFAARSGRKVDIYAAMEIARAMPPGVPLTGVFVDADAKLIRGFVRLVKVAAVQLHGDEPWTRARALAPLPVVKAVGPDLMEMRFGQWLESPLDNLAGLLLDSGGGTGVENDWDRVERLLAGRRSPRSPPPIHLAGGLTPENVGDIVRRFRPHAVDVSSGVEGPTHGRKDADKVAAFIAAVRDADST